MHIQGKKWLLDAHMRIHDASKIPSMVMELNQGKIKPNVFYQQKIVGEVLNARNISDTICVEILWYGNSFEQFEYKAEDCYIGIFKVLGEYSDKKTTV